MSRLLTEGFESGTNEVGKEGSPTVVETTPRTGKYCLSCSTGAQNAAKYSSTLTTGRDYYGRTALRFSSVAPSANLDVFDFWNSEKRICWWTVRTTGLVSMWNNVAGAAVGSNSAATLETGKWYVFEIHLRVNAAGEGTIGGRVYNEAGEIFHEVADSTQNVANKEITQMRAGCNESATMGTILVDDLALNNDQGSEELSWVPFADETVLIGYTKTGTTENDFSTKGESVAYKFEAKETGTLKRLAFQTNKANASQDGMRLLIFSDSSGKPGTAQGKTGWITANVKTAALLEANVSPNVALTKGTTYWLVVYNGDTESQYEWNTDNTEGSPVYHYNGSGEGGENGYTETWPGTGHLDHETTTAPQPMVYGRGSISVGQELKPDADLAATGWETEPLWEKLADTSDETLIKGALE